MESLYPVKRRKHNSLLRKEHCERLRCLLRRFMYQHNWKDASGVLSVLLLDQSQSSIETNRNNYVAAMELVVRKHEEQGISMKHTTVKNISDLWYRKNGPMKKSPKDKYPVLLEFIVYCLSHKKIHEANIAMTCMTQDAEFANDPVLNLIVGLVYYQLWYSSSIPEEMKLEGSDIYGASTPQDLSGLVSYDSTCSPTSSNKSTIPRETSTQDFQWHNMYVADSYSEDDMQSIARHERDMQIESSCEDLGLQDLYVPDSAESSYQDVGLQDLYVADSLESSSRGDSVSSTRIAKDPHAVSLGDTKMEPSNRAQDFYCAYSEEMSGDSEDYHDKKDIIFKFHGCDVSLLPLRLLELNENFGNSISTYLGTLNDNYIKGVKHLRVALYSTPPIMASLLPLVQLLLLGGKVEEAKKELENICKTSDSVRPLRIRANLLECVDSKNSITLSACYENILKKDPACSHSVGRLITIHKNGYYGVLPLLEMIAFHLDVTKGTPTIWEELASCFLKLSRLSFEEDKLSVCGDEEEDEEEDGGNFPLNSELWQSRCKWYWPEQHFDSYTSEQGDLKLLTVKAACASHLYGPGCKYTRSAFDCLEKEKKTRDLMCYLELHMNSSVNVSDHI